jgi:hypothetical protein
MQGRRFLDLAREILAGATDVHWRGCAGRAYYAFMLECRDVLLRWGWTIPRRDNVHTFVRLRFLYAAEADLNAIGRTLDRLGQLRNKANYDLTAVTAFTSDTHARTALREAGDALALLDTIDGDGRGAVPGS